MNIEGPIVIKQSAGSPSESSLNKGDVCIYRKMIGRVDSPFNMCCKDIYNNVIYCNELSHNTYYNPLIITTSDNVSITDAIGSNVTINLDDIGMNIYNLISYLNDSNSSILLSITPTNVLLQHNTSSSTIDIEGFCNISNNSEGYKIKGKISGTSDNMLKLVFKLEALTLRN